MTIHDKIEKRGLNRVQINHVLDVLAVYGFIVTHFIVKWLLNYYEMNAMKKVAMKQGFTDVLVNEKKTDKNYYNFRNVYSIKKIDGVNYLWKSW